MRVIIKVEGSSDDEHKKFTLSPINHNGKCDETKICFSPNTSVNTII